MAPRVRQLAVGRKTSRWPTLEAVTQLPWQQILLAWLCARIVVLPALVIARLSGRPKTKMGLLNWDAQWYQRIAEHGYPHIPTEAVRFFPAFPLSARYLAAASGLSVGAALLIVSNVAAIGFAGAAYRLAVDVGLPLEVADRVPWLVAFTPAGFVFVMGYAESLSALTVCLIFIAMRRRQWLWVAALGLLAGSMRPTGVVVALPIAIEVLMSWRRASSRQRGTAALAVFAPTIGLFGFLWWNWATFNEPLRPYTTQSSAGLRGGVAVNPVRTVWTSVRTVITGDDTYIATLGHLGWIAVSVAALVICARRLPPALTAYAGITLALAVTARGFTSFERYAASAFPLLIAGALTLSTPARRTLTACVAVSALFVYSLMALLHLYIP